jgi:hypothetical protein
VNAGIEQRAAGEHMSDSISGDDLEPGSAVDEPGDPPPETSSSETASFIESAECPASSTAWQGFAAAMGKAARATGRGVATAARVSAENRHYLLPVLNGFVGDQLAQAEAARRRSAAAADDVAASDPLSGAGEPDSAGTRGDSASARPGGADRRAVGGADEGAVGGAVGSEDDAAYGGADGRAVCGADGRAVGGAVGSEDDAEYGGADGRAVGGADGRAVCGADGRAVGGAVGSEDGAAYGGAAIRMSFRADYRDVDVAELDLGRRLVGAGRTVVVTIHGLMGNEVLFRETRWQSTSPEQPGHGERLARELGATVLHVRYNSGLHISTNGKALSALLQRLVDAHGEDMDRLVLLCHSMGGLVGRSAGYYAQRQQQGWVDKLAAVILIGVPMRGSFLEQFANLTSVVLHRVINFYTRLGARIIDERSDGIKDLRFGLMVDEDWAEHPYDDRLFAHKTIVPPLPGVDYHVIAGSIPKDDRALLSLVFGDGLVGRTSASGDVLFCPDDPHHPCGTVRFFPGTAHLQLLLHPAVGDHVVDLVRPLVG